MKGQICLLLLILFSTVSSTAQTTKPCEPAPTTKQLRVAFADIAEAERDVKNYNDTNQVLRDFLLLTDLKYLKLTRKYVDRVQDLKLEADIRLLQKDLQTRVANLK